MDVFPTLHTCPVLICAQAQKRLLLVARDASGAAQPVKRIHVYGKPWALAPDDYEMVKFSKPFLSKLCGLLPSWLGGRKK